LRRARSIAVLLTIASLLAIGAVAPAGVAASGDTLGSELMRLTNLDRQALGKTALAIDPTLATLAANRSFTCPSNGSMTVTGRAADMAARDYFGHTIKGCLKSDGTEYGSLDIVSSEFGYNTWRAENIAVNNYSISTQSTYDTGCAPNTSSGCPGAATTAITAVAVAQRGFMNSTGHRDNLLGTYTAYDRFGCGSGRTSDGHVYFSCLFSKGGPTALSGGDTTRPRITYETGKGAVYSYGSTRHFYATLSDGGGLKSGSVYIDGRRISLFSWSTLVTSARRSVGVSSTFLKRGTHTLIWHAYDRAGNPSTTLDGKVVFTVR
jgi:uncharacterized protein YkwD